MKNTIKNENKAITLVALVVTIIVLLLLAGIAIASLGGENGLLSKVKEAKKKQIESEMREQLTLGLQELQVEKNGEATLDDVTQEWIESIILNEYSPQLQDDASYGGKFVVMSKNGIIGKFLVNQDLTITTIEYNTSNVEIEYTTTSRKDNMVKINIVVTDKVSGIKQIEYPEGNPLKVVSGTKEQISIDYEVELGKEYKFIITSGDGNKTEKIIKIDDYFYNVTKDFGESVEIDNKAIKTAYNKTYEATISTDENYAITGLTVTMGEKTITTSGNDIVDLSTGKIKIDKVTDDINIKVTTKKLEIKYTAIAVSTSKGVNNTSTLDANTQERGTTLYINIIATVEGNRCTAVLKSDNSKAVPYAITKNGKYVFVVSGTYNGKTISEEKEVVVNQYMSAQGVVKYDAGDWTKEEIEELQSQNLYMINKEKSYNEIWNVVDNTGLNFTFGGFTYKGDTENKSDIESENIITSRNQSVAPGRGAGIPSYSGWQLFITETKKDESGNVIKDDNGDDKIYVTKIIHAGSSENFVYCGKYDYDAYRAEFLLSSGKRMTSRNKLYTGETINKRSWQMYIDDNQRNLIADTEDSEGNEIKDIHAFCYEDRTSIGSSAITEQEMYKRLKIGSNYIVASSEQYNSVNWGRDLRAIGENGGSTTAFKVCYGIRPVVSMADGVYIKSGSGTEEDPYVLGKD